MGPGRCFPSTMGDSGPPVDLGVLSGRGPRDWNLSLCRWAVPPRRRHVTGVGRTGEPNRWPMRNRLDPPPVPRCSGVPRTWMSVEGPRVSSPTVPRYPSTGRGQNFTLIFVASFTTTKRNKTPTHRVRLRRILPRAGPTRGGERLGDPRWGLGSPGRNLPKGRTFTTQCFAPS